MARRARLVVLSLSALVLALVGAVDASAHRPRYANSGFEPNDAVLACIRGPYRGSSQESGGNYANNASRRHKGAYQSDRGFEIAYAVKLIPPVHWWTLGSDTSQRAHTWHPLIQDEMARNGLRARGLAPWPQREECHQERF